MKPKINDIVTLSDDTEWKVTDVAEFDNLICGERYGKTTVFPDVVIVKINGDDI